MTTGDRLKGGAGERLIVALDFPSTDEARALTGRLGEAVGVYKIGLELIFAGGVAFAQELRAAGRKVFLDAKLHDIGATVEKATANIARLGVNFLTVHGVDRKTMDAAVRGRGDSDLKLLAVTVMTNLDARDLVQQGICLDPGALVQHRARLAIEAGFDGVIASGQEAKALRQALGAGPLIITPGIRPRGAARGDQERVTTPADAIADGADYLVVGRPITAAADPVAAAWEIRREIEMAAAGGGSG